MATDPELRPIDRRVFAILFRRYKRQISAIFRTRTRDPQQLEDFVQETYKRMMHRASLPGIKQCKAYLIRVACNLRSEMGLLHHREKDVLSFDSEKAESHLSQEQLGDTSDIDEIEVDDDFRFGMSQLPAGQREVMELHCTGVSDDEEIAEKLGISVDAVRQRRSQARKALAKHLWPSGQRRSAK